MNSLLDLLLTHPSCPPLGLISCAHLPGLNLPQLLSDPWAVLPARALFGKNRSFLQRASRLKSGQASGTDARKLSAIMQSLSTAGLTAQSQGSNATGGAQRLHALVSWVLRKQARAGGSPDDGGTGRVAVLPVLARLDAERERVGALAWNWATTGGLGPDFVVWNSLELVMLADFPSRTQVRLEHTFVAES